MRRAFLIFTCALITGFLFSQSIIHDRSSSRDDLFIGFYAEQSGHYDEVGQYAGTGNDRAETLSSSMQSETGNEGWKRAENSNNPEVTSQQIGGQNTFRQSVTKAENIHLRIESAGLGNEAFQEVEGLKSVRESEIFIHQRGENNRAYQLVKGTGISEFAEAGIEQAGSANYTEQEIRGGDFRVFAYQSGRMNTSFILLIGDANTVRSMQKGDLNISEVRIEGSGNMMPSASELISIPEAMLKDYDGQYLQSQFGYGNISRLIAKGSNNRTAQYQFSDIMDEGNNRSLISIDGDDNLALEMQAGRSNTAVIEIQGDDNITLLSQREKVGNAGWNESLVRIQGDGNLIEVSQYGYGNKSDAQLSGYNNQVRNTQR